MPTPTDPQAETKDAPIKPRIKIKKFRGPMHDHTTATLTYPDPETGKIKKAELRPYPDSHLLAVARKQDMEARDIDDSEAGLRPGQATLPMQDDSSDWSGLFGGFATFVGQAFNSKIVLLSKEQEIGDNGITDNLDRTTVEIKEDKLPKLLAYKNAIEQNEDIKYSVLDGENRKHCGTIVQDVLDIALEGEPEADIVKRTRLERWTSTHPTKVFERAKRAHDFQETGVLPLSTSATTTNATQLGHLLPSPLRRVWFAANHEPVRQTQPQVRVTVHPPQQAPRQFGLFGLLQLPTQPMRPVDNHTYNGKGPKF